MAFGGRSDGGSGGSSSQCQSQAGGSQSQSRSTWTVIHTQTAQVADRQAQHEDAVHAVSHTMLGEVEIKECKGILDEILTECLGLTDT